MQQEQEVKMLRPLQRNTATLLEDEQELCNTQDGAADHWQFLHSNPVLQWARYADGRDTQSYCKLIEKLKTVLRLK
jgi:hypothetical protein